MSYYGSCDNPNDHRREGEKDYQHYHRADSQRYNNRSSDCDMAYTDGYDRAEYRDRQAREEQREQEKMEERRQENNHQQRMYEQQLEEEYYYGMQQVENPDTIQEDLENAVINKRDLSDLPF